ncbi:MAG TPA: enoyl-CoA hydratase-related protein [Solirubrobacterales bacterium]|nr:enoyl-CoA hydratase-related protein [Solirubrobacterales bacterium]
MSGVVLYEVSEGVALVTLNRPDSLNAWTPELGRAYLDRLQEADADPGVRAIVVTGAGRGFCAGADFAYLQEVERSGSAAEPDPRPQSLPRSLRKPVIAAINGPCAGLGFVMAMMCDIRFAARGAKLTTAFARRGLIAEYGLSWVLPRVAGASAALDLLLSGRTLLAEEAQRLGVIDRVSEEGEAGEEAHAYAAELARLSSPASMAAIKRQLYADQERSLDQATNDAAEQMERSFERPDFREGVESFVERRAPDFPPLDA